MKFDLEFALVERVCLGGALLTLTAMTLLTATAVVNEHGTPPENFGQQMELVSWLMYAWIGIAVGYKPVTQALAAGVRYVRGRGAA